MSGGDGISTVSGAHSTGGVNGTYDGAIRQRRRVCPAGAVVVELHIGWA